MYSLTLLAASGSRLLDGSSMKTTLGPWIKERIIITICFSPPESELNSLSSLEKPNPFASSSALSSASSLLTCLRATEKYNRFCLAVSLQ